MNHFGRYITLFLFIGFCLIQLKRRVQSPERLIVGTWNERSWQYEKVGSPQDLQALQSQDLMAQSVKDQLGKHLVIHSAEVWQFKRDGVLLLHGRDTTKEVRWKLKGRGHILELQYADNLIEHYTLTELTPTSMALNFDSDIQVKGIAKLTFDHIDHVAQIQQSQNTGR
jgi:hypothetical protein